MGNFRDNNRRGFGGRSGGSRFGSRGSFNRGRDSGRSPRQKYDAVCDKCKKNCQVPFKPTGNRPVLCNDCFTQNGDAGNNFSSFSSNSRRSSPAPSQNYSGQLSLINVKLDKILAVLAQLEIVRDNGDNNEYQEDEQNEDEEDLDEDNFQDSDDASEERTELDEGIKREFQEVEEDNSDDEEFT